MTTTPRRSSQRTEPRELADPAAAEVAAVARATPRRPTRTPRRDERSRRRRARDRHGPLSLAGARRGTVMRYGRDSFGRDLHLQAMPLLSNAVARAAPIGLAVALPGLAHACAPGLGRARLAAVAVAAVAARADSLLPTTESAVEKPIGLYSRRAPPPVQSGAARRSRLVVGSSPRARPTGAPRLILGGLRLYRRLPLHRIELGDGERGNQIHGTATMLEPDVTRRCRWISAGTHRR
jgi:hypothetical protein